MAVDSQFPVGDNTLARGWSSGRRPSAGGVRRAAHPTEEDVDAHAQSKGAHERDEVAHGGHFSTVHCTAAGGRLVYHNEALFSWRMFRRACARSPSRIVHGDVPLTCRPVAPIAA